MSASENNRELLLLALVLGAGDVVAAQPRRAAALPPGAAAAGQQRLDGLRGHERRRRAATTHLATHLMYLCNCNYNCDSHVPLLFLRCGENCGLARSHAAMRSLDDNDSAGDRNRACAN